MTAVEASETEGTAAIQRWLSSSDFQKFDLKKQNMKKKTTREAWAKKTDAEKLKAYAQELKENLPALKPRILASGVSSKRLRMSLKTPV